MVENLSDEKFQQLRDRLGEVNEPDRFFQQDFLEPFARMDVIQWGMVRTFLKNNFTVRRLNVTDLESAIRSFRARLRQQAFADSNRRALLSGQMPEISNIPAFELTDEGNAKTRSA